MASEFQLIDQQHRRHDTQHHAQQLGYTDRHTQQRPVEQIQAVGAQSLNPGAAKAIPEQIELKILPIKFAVLLHNQNDQQQTD